MRLLTLCRSTRRQNSKKDLKGPVLFRISMIDSTAPLTDILDGRQAEPDGVVHHGKVLMAFVHVRRQDFDIEVSAFREVADDLVGVAHVGGHQGSHELSRVVRLEIAGLVADDGIGRGVRLVEPVACKLLDQFVELFRFSVGDFVRLCAGQELRAQLLHLFRLLSCPWHAGEYRLGRARSPPPYWRWPSPVPDRR